MIPGDFNINIIILTKNAAQYDWHYGLMIFH